MVLKKDVVVVGAGAAGMMCAIEAGKRGRSVLLLDHASKLAEKIRISGGGRCNFTNRYTRAENFISHNPHFCKSALARFSPQDFVSLVEKHGIRYHEKNWGNCSAMAARNRSSTCCGMSAMPRVLNGECHAGSAM